MPIMEYNGKKPEISPNSYVSPQSTLIGDVKVEDNAVIWPGSIIRAENSPIHIGEYSTIFDGVMMITRSQKSSVNIGRYCIIETGVSILGCFMEDYVQVKEGSLIYEEASIGEGVIVMNGSQVPPGLTIPARTIMRGIPVEQIREQTRNDVLKQKERAENYSHLFIKIKEQLPQAQGYLLTLSDFLKLMIKKEE
ncbi:MAG: gamma carbonic anhydrase family protein [Promethearchaeota archaeon]|jgi:carbonic anhydrase/acetyltransferase-like protein (isoleucine patch superfamily)